MVIIVRVPAADFSLWPKFAFRVVLLAQLRDFFDYAGVGSKNNLRHSIQNIEERYIVALKLDLPLCLCDLQLPPRDFRLGVDVDAKG